jgi:hypothetical protein
VILNVFEAILESNPLIVLELTPPILLTVVLNVPYPSPITSPVNFINWSPVFVPPTVTSPTTVNVVEVCVPPAIVNPFDNVVGVNPFMLVADIVPVFIELELILPDEVIDVAVISPAAKPPLPFRFTIVLGVLSDVAELTADVIVVIVLELNPPILFAT